MEFENIDDYNDYLMPKKEHKLGSDFKDLVTKYFDYSKNEDGTIIKNNDDLILCLFEMVTLKDHGAFGETLMRSSFKRSQANAFLSKYKKIINKVKMDPSCIDGISIFEDWYKNKGAFMLISSNPNKINFEQDSNWEGQPPDTREDPNRKRSLYAELKDDIFEDDIKKYLKVYYSFLISDLGFDKYPNTCVIVKPVSVSSNQIDDNIPLGNLYLHFATKTEKNKEFYLKFINDFMRVWFKEKGYEVIAEIQKIAKIEAFEAGEVQIPEYRPNFTKSKKDRLSKVNLAKGACLDDYYNAIYLSPNERKQFEESLFAIVKKALPYYFEIKKILDGGKRDGLFSHFSSLKLLFEKSTVSSLKTNHNISVFKNILIYREIYKIGILLFELDPYALHYGLTIGEYIECDSGKGGSIGTVFGGVWNERFIPFPRAEKYSRRKIVEDIKFCQSIVEKQYMEKYKLLMSKPA